jgi:hypothetical protein
MFAGCRRRARLNSTILLIYVTHALDDVIQALPGPARRIAAQAEQCSVLVEIALRCSALLAQVTSDAIVRQAQSPGGSVLGLMKSTLIEVLGT